MEYQCGYCGRPCKNQEEVQECAKKCIENGLMMNIDRKEYEKNLKIRKETHLKNIFDNKSKEWQPCLHEGCPDCIGTGIRTDGSLCVHMISCPCHKCTPRC